MSILVIFIYISAKTYTSPHAHIRICVHIYVYVFVSVVMYRKLVFLRRAPQWRMACTEMQLHRQRRELRRRRHGRGCTYVYHERR